MEKSPPASSCSVSVSESESEASYDPKFQSKIYPQVVAAFAATISAFGMGSVEAYTSPGLPSMEESGSLGMISESQKSQIASLALLAALLSGPPIGFLIGKIGRKVTLVSLTLPCLGGWILIATANNITSIYIGRLLTGFSMGAASLIVPIFIGEIAEDRIRGMLCSGFQIMVTIGNLFVYIVGSYVDWRWLAYICGTVPIFALVMMIFVPPSPPYLLSRGKVKEAGKALARLRGTKSTADVQFEFFSMQANVDTSNEEKKSFRDVFKMRTLQPMLISLSLLFFAQMTGIEAVLVFTSFIFTQGSDSKGGHTHITPNQSTILVGALQVIATFGSAFLVDRAGRRILLMTSGIGTSLSMLTLAIFFYFKDTVDPSLKIWMDFVPLVSIGSFIMFFAIGLGPVPFLMITELNSPAVIGLASAVATLLNWTFSYLVTAFFIDIEESIGFHWCFGMFSGISMLGVATVFFLVPETKGISMEKIQDYFRKTQGKVSISPMRKSMQTIIMDTTRLATDVVTQHQMQQRKRSVATTDTTEVSQVIRKYSKVV